MKNQIYFYKISGSGNDFIIIDNRDQHMDKQSLPEFAANVCQRKISVGADGLILIETSDIADFKWDFYNSDGSVAEMCGNGARCAARYAFLNNIAGADMSFETIAGIVSAHVKEDCVKIKMTDPFDFNPSYTIDFQQDQLTISSINTGVPHVVIRTDDIDHAPVIQTGRQIRFHDHFSPAGTNVNFICLQKDNTLSIRTYERGVEDETLACGTGAVAGAIVSAYHMKLISPVKVKTKSNEFLTIYFNNIDDVFSDIYLEGDARVIYKGELLEDAWKGRNNQKL
jgi:diaminopimelate epimerase